MRINHASCMFNKLYHSKHKYMSLHISESLMNAEMEAEQRRAAKAEAEVATLKVH